MRRGEYCLYLRRVGHIQSATGRAKTSRATDENRRRSRYRVVSVAAHVSVQSSSAVKLDSKSSRSYSRFFKSWLDIISLYNRSHFCFTSTVFSAIVVSKTPNPHVGNVTFSKQGRSVHICPVLKSPRGGLELEQAEFGCFYNFVQVYHADFLLRVVSMSRGLYDQRNSTFETPRGLQASTAFMGFPVSSHNRPR